MKLTLSEIAEILAVSVPINRQVTGYSIDSRTVRAGDLFFAIRGPRHNGHDYVRAALSKGAAAAVVEERHTDKYLDAGPILAVHDPADGLRRLAHQCRRRWHGQVVGVTGSNGKTTTKDLIFAALQTSYRVSKSEGNLNNELGMPLSMLRAEDASEIVVLEMGMNHQGEIQRLAEIAQPTVAVVTNVTTAHLENFSSVEGIALAKREIVESLSNEGTAVLNADDTRVRKFAKVHRGRTVTFGVNTEADFRAELTHSSGTAGLSFRLCGNAAKTKGSSPHFNSPLLGRHNIMNLLAAIAVASVFGIKGSKLRKALAKIQPASMRGEVEKLGDILVLNDCYNANPSAMLAMLEVLTHTKARRRIAVLGEMKELGEQATQLHREVGQTLAIAEVDAVVAVEGRARAIAEEAVKRGYPSQNAHFFEDAKQAGEFLTTFLKPGDVALFKASRGVSLEKALERVRERLSSS